MNVPVKVLQIFSSLDAGGAESRMMDVFRKIDRDRYKFDFLSMRPEPQFYEDEIQALGGRVIKIRPPRVSGVPGNIREMRKVMKEGQYDAVHAHTSFHCALACLAAKLAGVPVRIAHGRTTGSQHRTLKNRLSLCMGRMMLPLFSNVRLAISKDAGNYLFPAGKFLVLPNAIDCARYENVPDESVQALRSEFRIPAENTVIGMVGRYNSMKNHDFALRWFAHYKETHPGTTLVLVGGAGCGFMAVDVKKLAKDYGVEDSTVFAGERRDVPIWMNLFDVLIVPSKFEGLGGVILEAQAAGKPVLKSDTFTNEADLNLGLVQCCPIDGDFAPWDRAVEKALNTPAPSREHINRRFRETGYSLDAEIEELSRIYSGK